MADDIVERITILLQARDKDLERAIDRNNKLIAKFSREASQSTTKMERTIDANMSKVGKSVTAMGKTFVAGIAATAITATLDTVVRNIGATVKSIAEIGNEAKRSGLSTDDFQEWSYVAQQNRISVDSLVDGFKELSLRVDEFTVTGAGPAAEALERLGYTSDELKKKIKDPSELMLEMIGRMEKLDKAAQIRVSDELFGGTAGERFVELLGQGEGALRATIQAWRDAGAVLDEEMIQKADEIDRKWSALADKMQIYGKKAALGWADLISDMGTLTLDDILSNDALAQSLLGDDLFAEISQLGDMSKTQGDKLKDLAAQMDQVFGTSEDLAASLERISGGASNRGFDGIAATLSEVAHNISAINGQFQSGMIGVDEYNDLIGDTLTEAEAAAGGLENVSGVDMSAIRDQIAAIVGVLAAATAQSNSLNSSLANRPAATSAEDATLSEIKALGEKAQAASDYVAEQERIQGLTKEQLALERETASVKKDAAKAGVMLTDDQVASIATGNIAASSARSGGGGRSSATRETNELLRERDRILEDLKSPMERFREELERIKELEAGGLLNADEAQRAKEQLEALQPAAKATSDALRTAFDGIFENAESALDNLWKKLLEMALYQQLGSMFPSVFGGGGMIPLVPNAKGGVYSSAGLSSYSGSVVSKPTVFPFAKGAGLMGEAGPEAILPLTRGANGKLGVQAQSGGGGGTSVQVNNYSSSSVETKTQKGPDGRDMVTFIIKDEIAKGSLDKPMSGRFGSRTQKVLR